MSNLISKDQLDSFGYCGLTNRKDKLEAEVISAYNSLIKARTAYHAIVEEQDAKWRAVRALKRQVFGQSEDYDGTTKGSESS